MHETVNPRRQGGIAHVLRARDVDAAVVRQRAPDVHHGREVHDGFGALHRGREGGRPADVAPVGRDPALLQPVHVLLGQRQDADAATSVDERLDQMVTDEAVSSGNQYIHVQPVLTADALDDRVRYHATLRLTPSTWFTCGTKPSSRLARSMLN